MITDPNPNPGALIAEALQDLARLAARIQPLLHRLSFEERVQLASHHNHPLPQSPNHDFLKSTKDLALQFRQDGQLPGMVSSRLAEKLVPLLEALSLLQASVEDTILLSGMNFLTDGPAPKKEGPAARRHKKGPETKHGRR